MLSAVYCGAPAVPLVSASNGPSARTASHAAAICELVYRNRDQKAPDLYFSEASVGPNFPRGSRLGPDSLNNWSWLSLIPKISPMKQLLISSQFCGPQTTSLVGSGLYGLFAELSKCDMPITRVPLGNGIGFTKS